jgi:hypothetical protein
LRRRVMATTAEGAVPFRGYHTWYQVASSKINLSRATARA